MDNPITREEMYLAAAAGERLNLPEPITRVEHYLKRIAERYGGGTGTGGNVDLEGYATEQWVRDQKYLTEVPDGYAKTDDIPTKPEDIGALPNTYTPPDQTAEQVGADPKGSAASAVSQHNTANDSHGDIRLELKDINDRLTAFFDSDDQTLDELSEIVTYITSNKTLIDGITINKVSVADIIDNLTTNVANKPLSAAQGVVLKGLIDALSRNLENYQPKGDYALTSAIPTKVSQLQNDSGFVTELEKNEIVQEVIDQLGLNIIGEVDNANNILITANLPDGTYTIRYENADGSTTEIGTLTIGNTGPAYTNLADPASADWLTNKRINSSKNIVDVTESQRGDKTCVVTNFINISGVKKLHIKGLDIVSDLVNGSSTQNYGRVYDYNGATLLGVTYSPESGIHSKIHYTYADYDSSVLVFDIATMLKDFGGTHTSATHIRLGGILTGAASDVIITADEKIV